MDRKSEHSLNSSGLSAVNSLALKQHSETLPGVGGAPRTWCATPAPFHLHAGETNPSGRPFCPFVAQFFTMTRSASMASGKSVAASPWFDYDCVDGFKSV
jgi:hypothetical protein